MCCEKHFSHSCSVVHPRPENYIVHSIVASGNDRCAYLSFTWPYAIWMNLYFGLQTYNIFYQNELPIMTHLKYSAYSCCDRVSRYSVHIAWQCRPRPHRSLWSHRIMNTRLWNTIHQFTFHHIQKTEKTFSQKILPYKLCSADCIIVPYPLL